MEDEAPPVPSGPDPVPALRQDWRGRLSTLHAPGAGAALRRAARSPARGTLVDVGTPEPEPVDGARVLAKAARRAGRWFGLEPDVFEGITGLELRGEAVPDPESESWDRCLALVQLAGRLERKLGRRGVVRAWLRGPHRQLRPTPWATLAQPGGIAVIEGYLDGFER